jgi:hypothetical protein
MIKYSLYRVVASALVAVFANVILNFLQNTVHGDYRLGHWWVIAISWTVVVVEGLFACLKASQLVNGPDHRGCVSRFRRTASAVHSVKCRLDSRSLGAALLLRYFEESARDTIAVAYADFIVGQSFDGEVFSNVSVGEIVGMKLGLLVTDESS